MDPGEVTTVVMKFDMPFGAPPSPRLQAADGLRAPVYGIATSWSTKNTT
jgi:hypothetical protein